MTQGVGEARLRLQNPSAAGSGDRPCWGRLEEACRLLPPRGHLPAAPTPAGQGLQGPPAPCTFQYAGLPVAQQEGGRYPGLPRADSVNVPDARSSVLGSSGQSVTLLLGRLSQVPTWQPQRSLRAESKRLEPGGCWQVHHSSWRWQPPLWLKGGREEMTQDTWGDQCKCQPSLHSLLSARRLHSET